MGPRFSRNEFPGPPPGQPLVKAEHTIPGAGTMMRKALWDRLGISLNFPVAVAQSGDEAFAPALANADARRLLQFIVDDAAAS